MNIVKKHVLSILIFILLFAVYPVSALRYDMGKIWRGVLLGAIEASVPQCNLLVREDGPALAEFSYRYVPAGIFLMYSQRYEQYSCSLYHINDRLQINESLGHVIMKLEPYFEWGYIPTLRDVRCSLGLRLYFPIGFYERPWRASSVQPLIGGGYHWMPDSLGDRFYIESGVRVNFGGPNFDLVFRHYLGHPYLKYSFNLKFGFFFF